MTDRWSEQQLARFVRIREGFIKTGFSQDVAAAHARRALEQSRTERVRPSDPANPTKDELYREAMRYRIAGRSKMDKEQLFAAVHAHRTGNRGVGGH